LGFLKGLFGRSPGDETGKLGSDWDPIRQMLFASQSLKEQVQRMRLNGQPGPLQSIADAYSLVVSGKKTEAIAALRSVLPGATARDADVAVGVVGIEGVGRTARPEVCL
jgi:hypothetical protein